MTQTAKHTPAPWSRNINAKYPIYAGDAPNHVFIASIVHGSGSAPDEQKEANLRLITAAPEMLKALYFASERLSVLCDADEATELDNECLCKINAAIVKAKGE